MGKPCHVGCSRLWGCSCCRGWYTNFHGMISPIINPMNNSIAYDGIICGLFCASTLIFFQLYGHIYMADTDMPMINN